MTESLLLPRRTLLVLCGPAGSGKSTFAAQRFPPTSIVSSDHCRGMVCDDENEQTFNKDAFDLFYYILGKRMRNGFFCVADSVALQPSARRELRNRSRHYGYYGCLLMLVTPLEVCLQRDRLRTRQVGENVIRYHASLAPQAFEDAPHEGWERVLTVQESERDLEITIEA